MLRRLMPYDHDEEEGDTTSLNMQPFFAKDSGFESNHFPIFPHFARAQAWPSRKLIYSASNVLGNICVLSITETYD